MHDWHIGDWRPLARVAPHFACTPRASAASVWPTFTAAWYANQTAYDAWDGIDLTPYNRHRYPPRERTEGVATWADTLHDQPTSAAPLRAALCAFEYGGAEGGEWRVQRVGPFTSRGGTDWWQMSGADALGMRDVLTAQPQHAVFLVEALLQPVDESGAPIALPPLHPHHIHVLPAGELRYFRDLPPRPGAYRAEQYLWEQHGDAMRCDDADDGAWTCYTERAPLGYGKLIDFELHVDLEINDVRDAAAPPLTWYAQLAVRWAPAHAPLTPCSLLALGAGHGIGFVPLTQQAQMDQYTYIPQDGAYVLWHEEAFPRGATVLHVKNHVHQGHFVEALLYLTDVPDALQLHAVAPDNGPTNLAHTSAGTHAGLRAYLRERNVPAFCRTKPRRRSVGGRAYDLPEDVRCSPTTPENATRAVHVFMMHYDSLDAAPSPEHFNYYLQLALPGAHDRSCYRHNEFGEVCAHLPTPVTGAVRGAHGASGAVMFRGAAAVVAIAGCVHALFSMRMATVALM